MTLYLSSRQTRCLFVVSVAAVSGLLCYYMYITTSLTAPPRGRSISTVRQSGHNPNTSRPRSISTVRQKGHSSDSLGPRSKSTVFQNGHSHNTPGPRSISTVLQSGHNPNNSGPRSISTEWQKGHNPNTSRPRSKSTVRQSGHSQDSPGPRSEGVLPATPRSLNGTRLCITLGGMKGRVGNNMFQYAALLGTAAANNHSHTIVLSPPRVLSETFALTQRPTRLSCSNTRRVKEKAFAIYTPATRSLPPHNVTLGGYFQSWRYFHHIRSTIVREFTFRSGITERATALLRRCVAGRETATTVGVHVRQGDMVGNGRKRFGVRFPPSSYFRQASDYFRRKYGDVIFVVVSDDSEWCREHVTMEDYVIADDADWSVHMALLTLCDHVITTLGTFGWWGGYLGGGEVVYYNGQVLANSAAAKQYREADVYLPHWIGLGH